MAEQSALNIVSSQIGYTEKIVIPNSDNNPVLLGICVLKFGITFYKNRCRIIENPILYDLDSV